MARALRVLLIEDNPVDAALLVRELVRGGYEVTHERVDTAGALTAALDHQTWDLILSDYSMPSFDAPTALELVRARRIDAPFIIVSGTVDEVTAVASIRAGAHDFLAKGKLARLLPAIEREIREAANRVERKRLQEHLLLSDRMASLGTLAAGAAHEINNPLVAVLTNLDVVLLDLEQVLGAPDRDAQLLDAVVRSLEPLREAREAAIRVSDVSRDLKVFARGTEARRTAVDVRRVLDSSLRMAHNEIRHRARVVRDYEEVPAIAANETRIGQVFLNLLVNAAQAIPEGEADRHEIRVAVRRTSADRVVVDVQDTGRGIAEDDLSKIFELFFTTKPIGIGTGLGLAICYRIVTELGGEITVESKLGTGTTFRVTLPIGEPVEDAAPTSAIPREPARRARILIVDDDELVLRAARRILAPHHDVVVTTDARGALDSIVAGARFDLVLCDLLMPNLTGMAFHEELERRAPEHVGRMIFMTGGAFTDDARVFLESVKPPCIDKPFDASVLRRLLEML